MTQKSEYKIGNFGAVYIVFRVQSEEWYRFVSAFMNRQRADEYVAMLEAKGEEDARPGAEGPAPLGVLLGRRNVRAPEPAAEAPPPPVEEPSTEEIEAGIDDSRAQKMLASIVELYNIGEWFTAADAARHAKIAQGSTWHLIRVLRTAGYIELDDGGIRPTGKKALSKDAAAGKRRRSPVHRSDAQKAQMTEIIWKTIQDLTASGDVVSYVTVAERVGMSKGSIFPYVKVLKARGLIITLDARRKLLSNEERADIYRSGGIRIVEPIDRTVVEPPVTVLPPDSRLQSMRSVYPGHVRAPFNPALPPDAAEEIGHEAS